MGELGSGCHLDTKELYITFFKTVKDKIQYTNYDSLLLTEFVCIYLDYFHELITLEEIKMFIDMGANPSIELKNYRNSYIFTSACCYLNDCKIIEYLIYLHLICTKPLFYQVFFVANFDPKIVSICQYF